MSLISVSDSGNVIRNHSGTSGEMRSYLNRELISRWPYWPPVPTGWKQVINKGRRNSDKEGNGIIKNIFNKKHKIDFPFPKQQQVVFLGEWTLTHTHTTGTQGRPRAFQGTWLMLWIQREGSYSRHAAPPPHTHTGSCIYHDKMMEKNRLISLLITPHWERMHLALNESHCKHNEAPGKLSDSRFSSKLAVAVVSST